MFTLAPHTVEKPWGDNLLLEYSASGKGYPIGQVLTVSAQEGYSSIVDGGDFDGMPLSAVWKDNAGLFGFSTNDPFPFIIALVHAADDLSLQVHPNDYWAARLEGVPFGKEESWVFIKAPGSIVSGVKCSHEDIPRLIAANRWGEIYNTFPVNQGDYVYVPPGALHALTKGSFVYEIQQSSDFTYRFYDYDRLDTHGGKRVLHTKKALTVLDPGLSLSKKFFIIGKKYCEQTYCIWQRNLVSDAWKPGSKQRGVLKNDSDVFLCCTVIAGSAVFAEQLCIQGCSVILMPRERVSATGNASVMFAQSKRMKERFKRRCNNGSKTDKNNE